MIITDILTMIGGYAFHFGTLICKSLLPNLYTQFFLGQIET